MQRHIIPRYNEYQDDKNCVIADLLRTSSRFASLPSPQASNPQLTAYVRAGARKHLWYNKDEVGAVIVTCGGICPGLNNIIREIVVALYRLYGVTRVYGMMNGYGGFTTALENEDENVVVLTPEVVDSIHHQGGTFLRSARGGFNADNILTWCQKHQVNQIYVVGGDGTHRGANALFGEIQKRVGVFPLLHGRTSPSPSAAFRRRSTATSRWWIARSGLRRPCRSACVRSTARWWRR